MLVPNREPSAAWHVKVLDFGIAKLSQQASGSDGKVRTETGAMIGTPAYMAPEQCLADPRLDGKADVYALGIMLYELLAARLPFAAQHSFDFMSAHVRENPRPLAEVAPHVPPEVVNLVHSMLAKAPAERPSMEAVATILDQLQAALSTTWVVPQLAGPRSSLDSLVLGATAPGPLFPSPRPSDRSSRELLELGATISGAPIPSGQRISGATSAKELLAPSSASTDRERPAPLKSRRPVGALLLFLLLVCGAIAGVVGRLGTQPPTPATAPHPSPPPPAVEWTILSVPPGAEVLRADGQIIGATPWQLDRLSGPGETIVRVHHSGFQDKTVVLSHHTSVKIELRLEAVPVAPEVSPSVTTPVDGSAPTKHPRVRKGKPKLSGNDVQLLLD